MSFSAPLDKDKLLCHAGSQMAINHLLNGATFQLRLATYALLIIKPQPAAPRAATEVSSGEHALLPCYQGGRSFTTRNDTCQIGTAFWLRSRTQMSTCHNVWCSVLVGKVLRILITVKKLRFQKPTKLKSVNYRPRLQKKIGFVAKFPEYY